MEELRELPPFLSHENPQVRLQACQIIAGFSSSAEHQRFFNTMEPPLIPRLRSAMSDDDNAVAKLAVQAMINLAESPSLRNKMIDGGSIQVCIDLLKKKTNPNHPFLIMLLQNLTVEPQGAEKLAQKGQALEGLNTRLLLQWFTDPDRVSLKDDPYQGIANVLTNLSTVDCTRKLFTDPGRDILGLLKEQLRSKLIVRRQGCLGIMKNLFLDHTLHERLLDEGLGLWSEVLLLIVGGEPLDDDETKDFVAEVLVELDKNKRRDPVLEIRRQVLDIIDLLVSHKSSRKYLKATGTYIIVRELHKFEKLQGHSEAVMSEIDDFVENRLVQFLCLPEEDDPPELVEKMMGVPASAKAKKKREIDPEYLGPDGQELGLDPNAIKPDDPGLLRF